MTTPESPLTTSTPAPVTAPQPPRPLLWPALAGVSAAVIAIGTREEWGTFLVLDQQGITDHRGAMTFVAALVLIALSLSRLLLRLPDGPYYLIGGFFGGAALALPASYLYDVLTWGKIVILGNEFDIASASTGVYVSLGGAIAYVVALVWQFTQRRGPA